MAWVSRIATALFIIALPVLLVTSNVRILAGEVRFYERGFRAHDSDIRTGLPLSELDRAAREIISYFEDDSAQLLIVVNDGGDEVSLFNEKETRHMEDVKSLMRFVFRLNEVSIAYVIAYVVGVFLWAGAGSARRLAFESLGGIAVGLVVTGAVGIAAVIGFESMWERFHGLVFNNDLWRLNPATDRLIQMFPEPFWEEATYVLAGMTLAEALVIVGAALVTIVFFKPKPRDADPEAGGETVPAPDPGTVRPPRTTVVD
jgi:integral membrane protein (TIGR01906 family)